MTSLDMVNSRTAVRKLPEAKNAFVLAGFVTKSDQFRDLFLEFSGRDVCWRERKTSHWSEDRSSFDKNSKSALFKKTYHTERFPHFTAQEGFLWRGDLKGATLFYWTLVAPLAELFKWPVKKVWNAAIVFNTHRQTQSKRKYKKSESKVSVQTQVSKFYENVEEVKEER